MGEAITFPLRDNEYVNEYVKTMKEGNKDYTSFTELMNTVSYLEDLLKQSDKNMAEMKNQLTNFKEIQKHPIKSMLTEISDSMKSNLEAAKSKLSEISEKIVEFCKKIVENFKSVGISALDKTVSTLKLQDGFTAISASAAKNNKLSDQAISKIEAFSAEYHKAGLSLKNMGRIALGKEPTDTAKENGKLAEALAAPYRAQKAAGAKIERAAFVASRNLENLHTNAQIGKENQHEAHRAAKETSQEKEERRAEQRAARREAKGKTQKTDIFKSVEKHKEAVNAKKENKSKTQEAKKSKEVR